MNTDQAKNIQLAELLQHMGYIPVKKERGGTELKFHSPFRDETDASFNVNLSKNAWFDFGLGKGGNTLDFAIEYLRSKNSPARVTDALSWLSGRSGGLSFNQARSQSYNSLLDTQRGSDEQEGDTHNRQLVYIRDLRLTSKHVLSYLQNERSIPANLAQKYLRLVQYKNTAVARAGDKPFFAFGMKNRAGGWEIRAASDENPFKSALIKKDISLIKGQGSPGRIDVFEGMIDFLSWLVVTGRQNPEHDTLILHSLSGVTAAIEYIQQRSFNHIHLFVDNDASGDKAYERFVQEVSTQVIDERHHYTGQKDVNKYLVHLKQNNQAFPQFNKN